MKKHGMVYGFIAVVVASLLASGCSTVPKKVNEELTGIKTRVDTLEQRVETVETKQSEAATQPTQVVVEPAVYPGSNITPSSGGKSERISDIQRALKSAGCYDGAIDGIKGKQTKKAIKEFQKANGLEADGVVGTKTWQLLRRYL